MNITKAQNVNSIASGELSHIHATIDGEEMDVPVDEQNRHYAEIKKQGTFSDDVLDQFILTDNQISADLKNY